MSRLIMDGKGSWFGVRIIEVSRLSADLRDKVLGDAGISHATRRKIGRPTEIDWEGANKAAEQYIQKNGRPKVQARLVDFIMEWLRENDPPPHPTPRTVEKHVAKTFYSDAA